MAQIRDEGYIESNKKLVTALFSIGKEGDAQGLERKIFGKWPEEQAKLNILYQLACRIEGGK
ncbi:MAG: hypothetical protein WC852_06070 [Candidatus Nanoarchaeia archaeon]|jgi:hypothetical protein